MEVRKEGQKNTLLHIVIFVIMMSSFLFLLINLIYPMINMVSELLDVPYYFPYIGPIGTDFRVGMFYPAKALLEGLNPYVDYSLIYPPLVALISTPFRLFNVKTAYLIQVGVLFMMNVLSIYGAVFLAAKATAAQAEESRAPVKEIFYSAFVSVAIIAVSGYGFFFSMERGNFDIYIVFFALGGMLLLYLKPDWMLPQIILFSISAHLKIYPAILFVILLWKHGRKSILPLLLLNTALLFITGSRNAVEFIWVMSQYIQEPFIWIGNHSAASFASMVNAYLASQIGLSLPSVLFLILPVLIWIVSLLACLRYRYSFYGALWLFILSIPLMNVIPSTSHDYKLVLFSAPAAVMIYYLLYNIAVGQKKALIFLSGLFILFLALSRSYVFFPAFLGNKYPFILAFQIFSLIIMMTMNKKSTSIKKLEMYPVTEYVGVNRDDPIRYYKLPVFGSLYRRRVELALSELSGGERVLEIGFGSGVSFINLSRKYDEIYGLDLTVDTGKVCEFFQLKGIETHLTNGDVMQMPYPDGFFDSVLLISILEHLQPVDQSRAVREIARVLKPGGQMVYGVPVERPLMVFFFRLLGYNIHKHHFSTEKDVYQSVQNVLSECRLVKMSGLLGFPADIYEIGHFIKEPGRLERSTV